MMSQYAMSALGGLLIGASSAGFLLLTGRVAGISGILGGVMRGRSARWFESVLFTAGLLLGPIAFRIAAGAWPVVRIDASYFLLIVAGLLVGYGTRLGSGCTSGHGVSGLARLSPRSFAAVGTFLAMGMVTVFVMRRLGA